MFYADYDHDMVTTPHGQFPILPSTSEQIPIHYIESDAVLRPDGHWTIDALERAIGRPDNYATRTTRAFIVLPEVRHAELKIDELTELLKQYAEEHDLNIKLTHYASSRATKVYINGRHDDPTQKRLSIDILGYDIINWLHTMGPEPGIAIMSEMHLSVIGASRDEVRSIDIDAMARKTNLQMPRNTEYDYTVLRVHRIINGEYVTVDHEIIMISVKG